MHSFVRFTNTLLTPLFDSNISFETSFSFRSDMCRYLAFSIIVLSLAGATTTYLVEKLGNQTTQQQNFENNSGRSIAPGGVGGHQSQLSAVPGNI